MDAHKWLTEDCEIFDYELIGDNYFIGRYRVIFGYRIRGGVIGDGGCAFDVCCGTSEEMLTLVQTLYKAKIEKNFSEGLPPHTGLRVYSEIKPIFNDLDYMKWLAELKEEVGK